MRFWTRGRSAAVAGLAVLLGAACSSFSATSMNDDGGTGAEAGVGPEVGGADSAGSGEAGADAGVPPCPVKGGAMIDVPGVVSSGEAASPGFCIDATEVTRASYAAFLSATGGGVDGQIGACAWNKSYQPECDGFDITAQQELPMTCIDWCDAYAFCSWAGKRLCGDPNGSYEGANTGISMFDQWTRACSHENDGAHAFAYGPQFEAGVCNLPAPDAGLLAVGAAKDCQGGYPGIFDMVGNAAEWVDSCFYQDAGPDGAIIYTTVGHDAGSPSDACRSQGGSYLALDNNPTSGCTAANPVVRSIANRSTGFRCCAFEH